MTPAILVIEDDAGVGALIHAVLSRSGRLVLRAQTGREAMELACLHRDQITLILSDVILDDESCQRTIGELRETCPAARVLLLSGFPLDILLERQFLDSATVQTDGTFFLQKPFSPKDLLEHVQSILPARQGAGAGVERAEGAVRYAAH